MRIDQRVFILPLVSSSSSSAVVVVIVGPSQSFLPLLSAACLAKGLVLVPALTKNTHTETRNVDGSFITTTYFPPLQGGVLDFTCPSSSSSCPNSAARIKSHSSRCCCCAGLCYCEFLSRIRCCWLPGHCIASFSSTTSSLPFCSSYLSPVNTPFQRHSYYCKTQYVVECNSSRGGAEEE